MQLDVLTVQETAALLGVHEMTVYDAITAGRLPAERLVGRWVIKRSDVDAYRERARPDGKKRVGRPRGSLGRPSADGGRKEESDAA